MSLGSSESVRVKDEPSWDLERAAVDLHEEHEAEIPRSGLCDHVVKAEGLESEEDASAAESSSGLYEGHVVKEELEWGPEEFHRPKVTLVCRGPSVSNRTCSVRLERMCVDVEHRTCRIGHYTYKFQQYLSTFEDRHIDEVNNSTKNDLTRPSVSNRTCSVRLERMCVDVEHRTCRIGHYTYKFQQYLSTFEDRHIDEVNNSTKNDLTSQSQGNDEIEHPGITYLRNKKALLHRKSNLKEKKLYKCDSCSYVCTHRNLMYRHKWTHIGEKPLKCSYCSKTFIERYVLNSHERIHTGEKPYKCSYCSYTCNHAVQLRIHETRHTGEKPFMCSYCSYTCVTKCRLKYHERTHTGKKKSLEKPFKCGHCNYTCSTKCYLKRHEKKHFTENPFKCSYCSYTCREKISLVNHERKHTGEKPYKCSYCSYTCRLKVGMKNHEIIHTGEKPFKCGHCSYACNRKTFMKTHEMIHTGEKPFKCSYCSYSCRQKIHLKIHLKNHERTHMK